MRAIDADSLIDLVRDSTILGRGFKQAFVAIVNGEPTIEPTIIRCKDCKHFEYDHPYIIQGVPVLGHDVCIAWGDGCKTSEDGYCFLAERRES